MIKILLFKIENVLFKKALLQMQNVELQTDESFLIKVQLIFARIKQKISSTLNNK